MKILLTVHQFPPKYISGTEVLTYSVARELMSRGHEVRVLTGAPGSEPLRDAERFDEYEIDGIKVYRFTHAFVPMGDQSVIMEMEYCNRLVARYFRMILDSYQPDLVHVFHMSRLGVGMIDIALQQNIPIYFTPTDFWSVCPTSLLMLDDGSPCAGPDGAGGNCVRHVAMRARWSWIADAAKRTPNVLAGGVVRLAQRGMLPARMPYAREIAALGGRPEYIRSRLNALNGIVSPTSLMTDALIRNGIDPALIRQHMFGINLSNFVRTARRCVPGAVLRVGFIGGLMKHKGCHLLIEAVRQMVGQEVTLQVYGNPMDDPPYYAQLVEEAAGDPAIEFRGTFANEHIHDVLAGIDVLVVPSVWLENAPLVIHSALASGCPVVASDFPGMSEVVRHEMNGLLFEPGSVASLKRAIGRLLTDDGLLTSLSENCRPPKGIATYVDELLDVYRAIPVKASGSLPFQSVDVTPFDPSSEANFMMGWAVMDGGQPKKLIIRTEDGECLMNESFSARPDVRKGLERGGCNLRSDLFGFRISFPKGLDRDSLVVELVGQNERLISYSLKSIACGEMRKLDDGCYLGLDNELFERTN